MLKKPDYRTWIFWPCQPSRTLIVPPCVHSAPFVDLDYFRKLEEKYEEQEQYQYQYYQDEEEYEDDEYDETTSYGSTSWQWEPDENSSYFASNDELYDSFDEYFVSEEEDI